MLFVKQYGYYRCGTNFTKEVMRSNFECYLLENELGCKHFTVKNKQQWQAWVAKPDRKIPSELLKDMGTAVRDDTVRSIVTVKDPYGWMSSFALYLRKRARKNRRFRPGMEPFHVMEFNKYYRAWTRMTGRSIVVRYEDLLRDYEGMLKRISEELDVPLKPEAPVHITKRVDPHGSMRGKPFDAAYWLERQYMSELKPQFLEMVWAGIDWDLFGRLGYAPHKPLTAL